MARTIGSSLAAKAAPGSASRGLVEKRNEEQNLLGRGKIGSLERAQIEEPLERAVPAGSAKIAAQQPLVEGGVAPTFDLDRSAPPVLSPSIGLNTGSRVGARNPGVVAPQIPVRPESSFTGAIDGSSDGGSSNPGSASPSVASTGNAGQAQRSVVSSRPVARTANANATYQAPAPQQRAGSAPTNNKLGGGAIGTVGEGLLGALQRLAPTVLRSVTKSLPTFLLPWQTNLIKQQGGGAKGRQA